MFNTIEVLAKSLSAARLRVNTLASNIANAETTRTPEGGPYKRKDIIQMAVPVEDRFATEMDKASLASPVVAGVVEDQSAPRMVFQPGHPDANKDGYVAYPNINVVTTMTDLMSATRLYQANVTAVEAARDISAEANRISTRT
jgi:flagellar basal-body rod protein FlgC